MTSMFRTIKVALPVDTALVQTALAFNEACQIVLNYGSQRKTYDKNALNKATYRQVREALPNLPSAMVQTARDEASEMLRRTGCAATVKKRLSVRYDKLPRTRLARNSGSFWNPSRNHNPGEGLFTNRKSERGKASIQILTDNNRTVNSLGKTQSDTDQPSSARALQLRNC